MSLMSNRTRLALYNSRSCDACTVCCTTERVMELQKEPGVTCEHLATDKAGCSRYETRPKGCREWACVWRSGSNLLEKEERPDLLGVVFDSDSEGVLYAKESKPQGFQKGVWVIKRLIEKGRIVVLTSADGKEGRPLGPTEKVEAYVKKVMNVAQ